MKSPLKFVAVDLGASSGRLVVSEWNGRTFSLEEIHRFANQGVSVSGNIYWDVLSIWAEIQKGLAKYKIRFGDSPSGIGVDAWGVDFALLDRRGRLISNPFHYRDPRTNGIPKIMFRQMDEKDLFSQTGVQTMQINTIFQLYSMVLDKDPGLQLAETLLMIPDLFAYFMTGEKAVEYSEATTTQMYLPSSRNWATRTLQQLGIPTSILPSITWPGSILTVVRPDFQAACGFAESFPVVSVATHDTASAVAAIPHLDTETAFISSGTWSLMGVELPAPNTSPEAFTLGFTNEGGPDESTLLMRNITGLWIMQECLREWNKQGLQFKWDEIIATAASAIPLRSILYPNALAFLAPANMPDAIQSYCRASAQPVPETVGEFARCCFESLSLAYRSTLQALRTLTARNLRTLCIVGGGCHNTYLCQMTADACNCTVRSGPAEASALGNVMLQAVATGHLPHLAAGRCSIGESTEFPAYLPHPGSAWDEAFARYQSLEASEDIALPT